MSGPGLHLVYLEEARFDKDCFPWLFKVGNLGFTVITCRNVLHGVVAIMQCTWILLPL